MKQLTKPRKESEATRRLVRRAYIQMNKLIECGGALAEVLLYLQRNEMVPNVVDDVVRTHIANWDAAVLAIPQEFIG